MLLASSRSRFAPMGIVFACVACCAALSGEVRPLQPVYKTQEGRNAVQTWNQGDAAYKEKKFKDYLDLNLKVLEIKLVSALAFSETEWYRASAHYCAACGYALTGDKEKALDMLDKAIDMGDVDAAWMQKDTDFVAIRGEKRFAELSERAARMNTQPRSLTGMLMDKREFGFPREYAWYLRVDGKSEASAFSVILCPDDLKPAKDPAITRKRDEFYKKIENLSKEKTAITIHGSGGTASTHRIFVVTDIRAAASVGKSEAPNKSDLEKK